LGVLALKELNPFLDQLQKGRGGDLQLMRGDEGLVDPADEDLVARFLSKGGDVFLEETALAGHGFDHAQALQFGVGLGDGVAVEAQLLGQRADGGERFAGLERARGGGVTDLIDQLEIDGLAGLEIDLKCHTVP